MPDYARATLSDLPPEVAAPLIAAYDGCDLVTLEGSAAIAGRGTHWVVEHHEPGARPGTTTVTLRAVTPLVGGPLAGRFLPGSRAAATRSIQVPLARTGLVSTYRRRRDGVYTFAGTCPRDDCDPPFEEVREPRPGPPPGCTDPPPPPTLTP